MKFIKLLPAISFILSVLQGAKSAPLPSDNVFDLNDAI